MVWSAAVVVTCLFFLWSANPVHGVLSLVGVGLGLAAGLLAAGLEFSALIVVLVYVGAVTVLFVFVVMMVNLRASPASYLTAEGVAVWVTLVAVTAVGTTGATPVAVAVVGVPLHQGLNLPTLGAFLYGTTGVTYVAVVGLILFVAMLSAICLSLVAGESYRTQEFYSQIRKPNAVFILQTQSND